MVDLHNILKKTMKQLYKYLLTLPILLLIFFPTHSQEQNKVNQGQYWLNYSIGTNINSNWSVRISTEDRRYFINNRNHMFYVLSDATYKLNKNWSFTGGFMYFNLHRPSDPHAEINVVQTEFRPYQRAAYKIKASKKSSFSFALTLEERIRMEIQNNERTNNYFTYLRFRNKLSFKYQVSSLDSTHPLSIYVYDDFMVHYGNAVKGDPFDQNRLAAGFEWKASKSVVLKSGYLRWYQQIANSATVYNRNIITFAVAQRL